MNRRSFFNAFVGAAASPSKKPEPLVMAVGYSATCGRCLGAMIQHGSGWDNPADVYLTCERPGCPQYHVPLKVPTVACERANPVIAECASCGRSVCPHANARLCRIDQEYRTGVISRYGSTTAAGDAPNR